MTHLINYSLPENESNFQPGLQPLLNIPKEYRAMWMPLVAQVVTLSIQVEADLQFLTEDLLYRATCDEI